MLYIFFGFGYNSRAEESAVQIYSPLLQNVQRMANRKSVCQGGRRKRAVARREGQRRQADFMSALLDILQRRQV